MARALAGAGESSRVDANQQFSITGVQGTLGTSDVGGTALPAPIGVNPATGAMYVEPTVFAGGTTNIQGSVIVTSGTILNTGTNVNVVTGTQQLLTTVSNLTNGSINILSGTLLNTGTNINMVTGTQQLVTTVSNLTNGSINVLSGTLLNTGTNINMVTGTQQLVTTVSNLTNGSVNILTGTITNVGTNVGIGTLSNVGSVNTVTTVANVTNGSINILTGTITKAQVVGNAGGIFDVVAGSPTPANALQIGVNTGAGNLNGWGAASQQGDNQTGNGAGAISELIYNGSNYERLRVARSANNTIGTGLLGAGAMGQDTGGTFHNLAVTTGGSIGTLQIQNHSVIGFGTLLGTPAAAAGTAIAGTFTALDIYRSFNAFLNLKSVGGTALTKIYLQTSPDAGVTWVDYACFASAGSGATSLQAFTVSRYNPPITTGPVTIGTGNVPALGAGSIIGGDFGDRIRVVYAVGAGGTNAGTAQLNISFST